MTTLALGVVGAAVGFYIGGPVGASIGFNLGAAVGSALDPPKVEGPRLNDLKLQTSVYGAPIPIVYGAFRLAGQVIWQTELVEHKEKSGGKGGPEVTSYTYSASYAIQICEGPVIAIRRIWADARLIRDGAELGTDLPITIYLGTETQTADPTMEAALGVGEVPAHRGNCYVVFADHYLTAFGNRIPNLEFEILTAGTEEGEDNCPITSVYRAALSIPPNPTGGWRAQIGPGTITARIPYITAMLPYGELETPTEPTVVDHPYPPYSVSWTAGAFGPEVDHGARVIYWGPIHTAGDLSAVVWVQAGRPFTGRPEEVGRVLPEYFNFPSTSFTLAWGGEPASMFQNTASCSGITTDGWTLDKGQFSGTAGYRFTYTAIFGYDRSPPSCIVPPDPAGLPISGSFPGYVHATVGSHGNKRLFVMTGPNPHIGTPGITEWHELQSGVRIRSGTVVPSLSQADFGFGPSVQYQYVDFPCSEAEENGRYIWAFYGAGATPTNAVSLYWIDDAGNLAIKCAKKGLTTPADGASFLSGAISAFAPGKCVVVAYKHWEIFERGGTDGFLGPNDSEKVTLASIVNDISSRTGLNVGQYNTAQLTDLVTGYCVTQRMECRAAIQALMAPHFFDAVESDAVVKFVKRSGISTIEIPDDDLAAHMDGDALPALTVITHGQEDDMPRSVSVGYINQSTDYQVGFQMAQRQTGSATRDPSYQMALVLSDAEAKRTADALLYSAWIERDRYSVSTTRKYLKLEPTDVITAGNRQLRLTQRIEGATGVVSFEALSNHGGIWTQAAPSGDTGGGYVPPPSPVFHVTEFMVLDIPLVTDDGPTWGQYVAMADIAGPDWPGAILYESLDGGNAFYSLTPVSTNADAFGRTTTTLANFQTGNIFDELSTVTVVLTAGSTAISSQSALQVLNGGNHAMVGSEMIQFKNATLTAALTYRLSGLLRGRRGTEWAMATHSANERFVLLPTQVTAVQRSVDIGHTYIYRAVTTGNTIDQAMQVSQINTGVAIRPYAPVHLGGGRNAAGDIILNWTRRVILQGQWGNNTDVPFPPEGMTFTVFIYTNSTYLFTYAVIEVAIVAGAATTYTLTAADQTTYFGSPQATLYWGVLDRGGLVRGKEARGII